MLLWLFLQHFFVSSLLAVCGYIIKCITTPGSAKYSLKYTYYKVSVSVFFKKKTCFGSFCEVELFPGMTYTGKRRLKQLSELSGAMGNFI